MAEENLDTLRRLYDRWGAGDWTETALFDRHAVGIFPDPNPRAQYGIEAMNEYMGRFLSSWTDIRIAAVRYRAAGDTILVDARLTAAGKTSGVPIENEIFHAWTFRAGLVIRMEVFERESEALQATGVPK